MLFKYLARSSDYYLKFKNLNNIIMLLFTIFISSSTYTLFTYNTMPSFNDVSLKLTSLILVILSSFLLLVLFTLRKLLYYFFENYNFSRIKARTILMFCIVAIIPTIIVSAFSIFIFNLGIQSWFDDKVSESIRQSTKVAELYIGENKRNLKDNAITISNDLNDYYYELIHNPLLLNRILNTQIEMRSLTEAIIFQKNTNVILAQTPLSFSLSFWNIPKSAFEKADNGEVVDISSDSGKMLVLIKLWQFDDAYLLIGKLVDREIISYIDKTNGAANKYFEMINRVSEIQIKYSLSFIMLAFILMCCAIYVGSIFAAKIATPIMRLVNATEKVQSGDLTVSVEVTSTKKDEISILTNAFNKMVKKIDIQQKDLALAQRALAWQDVASRVAHEIKNPLTPILLSADRIKKKFENQVDDKESFIKYINNIQRHTKDIQNIISDFSDFAKIPSPSFQTIEIISKLSELLESRKILDEDIDYDFHSNIDELYFKCDSTQLNQIIINLLKNSEEALENIQEKKKISLALNKIDNEIEISITDNGKGFPRDLIDKVTEPYLTTRSKGTGLGLAIVKKITQDHGGEVIISNSETGGAVVKLIFEIAKQKRNVN